MKVFEIKGTVEVHYVEPFEMGPELRDGDGKVALGYISFRNGDNSLKCVDVPDDALMRWPVWMGELQTMEMPNESMSLGA
jgi:hypothetical protein